MRLAYVTNLPAPYRVAFLNELGKLCDLTVFYERHTASDRDAKWRGDKAETYREIYCNDRALGMDRSMGFDLMRRIRAEQFDRLLISGYSSPAVMALILDCQRRGVSYYMQYDGGFDTGSGFKGILKRRLLRPATGHFTSADVHAAYLRSLGIAPECIWKYPFTSLTGEDILPDPISDGRRAELRQALGVMEKRVVLAVGQFIPRKGFDILLHSTRMLGDRSIGVYFVGGKATPEYRAFCDANDLRSVHFVGFQSKQQLQAWYQAADVFCLPTRYDIWGLVVNEALANALPVVTTTACCAGLELIQNGVNGVLVPPEDPAALTEAIRTILRGDAAQWRREALKSVDGFTAAAMAHRHAVYLLPEFCQKEEHERVACND